MSKIWKRKFRFWKKKFGSDIETKLGSHTTWGWTKLKFHSEINAPFKEEEEAKIKAFDDNHLDMSKDYQRNFKKT